MLPTREEAEALLREAEQCNPGPWGDHSRTAAHCAEAIAAHCPGLDPDKAYILGLLHDIGRRFGVRHLGHCVYCNHCQPCPAGIDIGLVNKYYDLSRSGDRMAHDHYSKLTVRADACLSCGHCDRRCPFKVHQQSKMKEIAAYFGKGE